MSGKPVLPCPPWCTTSHEAEKTEPPGHVTVRAMADGDTYVALCQIEGSDLNIHVTNHQIGQGSKSLLVAPHHAPDVAGLFERLGHEDIAVAITELALLASGGGTP